jgi:hypothetical protein
MRQLGDRRGTAELLIGATRITQRFPRITRELQAEAQLLSDEVQWVKDDVDSESVEV